MRKMPLGLRAEMQNDPFYSRCCITGQSKLSTKIEWHHNFIFAGRQVNEKWCILPLAKEIHDRIELYKERCDWIMLNRADEATLTRYSKAIDLVRRKEILNKKYGTYSYKAVKY